MQPHDSRRVSDPGRFDVVVVRVLVRQSTCLFSVRTEPDFPRNALATILPTRSQPVSSLLPRTARSAFPSDRCACWTDSRVVVWGYGGARSFGRARRARAWDIFADGHRRHSPLALQRHLAKAPSGCCHGLLLHPCPLPTRPHWAMLPWSFIATLPPGLRVVFLG